MEKLELLIKDLKGFEGITTVNRLVVLERLQEIHQDLQLHKTQVSGSVFVVQNRETLFLHGCFKRKSQAEKYVNGSVDYAIINLSVK